MNIGFYLARETQLKTMGAVIDEYIARRHHVILYYGLPSKLDSKGYQMVKPQKLGYFSRKRVDVIPVSNFSEVPGKHKLDILFVLEGYHSLGRNFDDISQLRQAGTKVVSLAHFLEICQHPLEVFDKFDLIVYPSEFALDMHFAVNDASIIEKNAFAKQYAVAGHLTFDQVSRFSREQARRDLQLSQNDRLVLLFSPTMTSETPWRYYVWGQGGRLRRAKDALRAGKINYLPDIALGNTYADIFSSIHQFCCNSQALLFVKSRLKHKDPEYVVKAADQHFDGSGEEYYPLFTSYKLLAAADLCIAVNSMASAEAVAFGVPCINIQVPHLDFNSPLSELSFRYYDILMNGSLGTLMNYEGCITSVTHRKFSGWLTSRNWDDFSVDQRQRKEYLAKFFGFTGEPAAKRVFAACERTLGVS